MGFWYKLHLHVAMAQDKAHYSTGMLQKMNVSFKSGPVASPDSCTFIISRLLGLQLALCCGSRSSPCTLLRNIWFGQLQNITSSSGRGRKVLHFP